MPYIAKENREVVNAFLSTLEDKTTADKMIACVTKFTTHRKECYATYNDLIGALYGALLEFNRRFEFTCSMPAVETKNVAHNFELIFNTAQENTEKETVIFTCAGDLNYAISFIVNDAITKLSDILDETDFRHTATMLVYNAMKVLIKNIYLSCGKYEDKKISENGDVYTILGD